MKKALVMIADLPEYQKSVGDIFRVGESSEISTWTWTHRDKMTLVDVPSELEAKSDVELEAELTDVVTEVEGVEVTNQEYVIKLNTEMDKANRISELYNIMMEEILAEMKVVFGTNSTDSANADKETYSMMVEAPEDYSGLGLTSRFDVSSISIGDALDTDEKITEYATGKLADIRAYGVYRMARKQQFKNDKSVIEAE